MPTILLVDDEEELRITLKNYLSSEGYTIKESENVEGALAILKTEKIDLILSDIKMPGQTGLDFFEIFKQSDHYQNKIPFVLMTGYADLITVENSFKLGVSELISKPFNLESIILVINYLLSSEKSFGAEDKRYFAVPIEDYLLANTNRFDLYVKSETKHVLVSKADQDFLVQRLKNFAQKGVTHIYLNFSSFTHLLDFKMNSVEDFSYQRPMDEAQVTYLKDVLINKLDSNYLLKKIDSKILARAVSNFKGYLNFALCNHEIINLLYPLFEKSSDHAEKLSVRCVLAIAIASQWKWNSPKVQFRIMMGSLLCDVGLGDQHDNLYKNLNELSVAEQKMLSRHPQIGAELLLRIKNLPEEIRIVALQHHENCSGTGFPKGLVRNQIHSYSRLVHDIDEFLSVIFRQNPIDISKSLLMMNGNQSKDLNKQVVKTLYLIFCLKMPQALADVPLPNIINRLL